MAHQHAILQHLDALGPDPLQQPTSNIKNAHIDILGRQFNLFTEFAGPNTTHFPDSQPFVRVQAIEIVDNGARATVAKVVVLEPPDYAPNWEIIMVVRLIKDDCYTDLSRYHDRLRAKLGWFFHHSDCDHLVGVIAWSSTAGFESVELMPSLIPLSRFLPSKTRALLELQNRREEIMGSCLKSILVSLAEMQCFADDFNAMLPDAHKIQEQLRSLAHGDLKIENLMVDQKVGKLRLGDFDTTTCMAANGGPVRVTRATTVLLAPPELVAGSLHIKSDLFMAAVCILRLFTTLADFTRSRSADEYALKLRVSPKSAVGIMVWRLMQPAYNHRPSLQEAIGGLDVYETDLFASHLVEVMESKRASQQPDIQLTNSHIIHAIKKDYGDSPNQIAAGLGHVHVGGPQYFPIGPPHPLLGSALVSPGNVFNTTLFQGHFRAFEAAQTVTIDEMVAKAQAASRAERNGIVVGFVSRFQLEEERCSAAAAVLTGAVRAIVTAGGNREVSLGLEELQREFAEIWKTSTKNSGGKQPVLNAGAYAKSLAPGCLHYWGRIFMAFLDTPVPVLPIEKLIRQRALPSKYEAREALKLLLACGLLLVAASD